MPARSPSISMTKPVCLVRVRVQHNTIDQAAENFHRFMLRGFVGEGFAQLQHRLAVARPIEG